MAAPTSFTAPTRLASDGKRAIEQSNNRSTWIETRLDAYKSRIQQNPGQCPELPELSTFSPRLLG